MADLSHVDAHGALIPALGLGTWPLKGETCERAVAAALACGYRHIDTAAMYGNEEEVGRAVKASGIARDKIWLTTKVWREDIGAGALQRSAEASLKRLGISTVDLLLIHWPNADIPLKDSIAALCDAKKRGLARHIGVSNFTTKMMREAVALTSEPLAVNQVEYHPHLDQSKVIACARQLGMAVTSYCPLGRGDVGGVMSEPVVLRIAKAHGKTAAQVVLRWHVQQPGVIAVPKSATPLRIVENFAIVDFALTAADMAAISQLARPGSRVVNMAFAPAWDV
jgi:diketogulonate reductase-like aldo/keto reductase